MKHRISALCGLSIAFLLLCFLTGCKPQFNHRASWHTVHTNGVEFRLPWNPYSGGRQLIRYGPYSDSAGKSDDTTFFPDDDVRAWFGSGSYHDIPFVSGEWSATVQQIREFYRPEGLKYRSESETLTSGLEKTRYTGGFTSQGQPYSFEFEIIRQDVLLCKVGFVYRAQDKTSEQTIGRVFGSIRY